VITVNSIFIFKEIKKLQQYSVRRDYRYDSNSSLAHDRELEMLTAEMTEELAQRITEQFLRQLSTTITTRT